MPPFRDDHILIISPGSRFTCAQLGLPESFSPPKLRIPSRMFPGIEEGTWTFTKIREARDGEKEDLIAQAKGAQAQADEEDEEGEDDDDEDEEGEDAATDDKAPTTGEKAPTEKMDELKLDVTPARPKSPPKEVKDTPAAEEDDEVMGDGVYVEDEDDEEGAVWCMKEGKVIDWGCFFALLTYVHETINPTFHTPLLMLHPPTFSGGDKELLTQFVFEKLKVPGFALVEASTAALWAYGLATATVVDVGFEKTDITPISDFITQSRARQTVYDCGGETMTKHLASLLPELKHEDAERLKTSPICEILPLGMPLPGSGDAAKHLASEENSKPDDELLNEEDGTVNVAAIVASGKTHEFLSKKEKERRGEAERRLPNRERVHNTFWTIDKKKPGEEEPTSPLLTSPITEVRPTIPTADGAPPAPPPAGSTLTSPTIANAPPLDPEAEHRRQQDQEKRRQEKRAAAEGIILADDEMWVEVSVGTERFRAAECGILQNISDVMFRAISKVEDVSKRADLWDNIIVVGNGAKVKGFKEAFLQTLQAKYLIPPSTGTIFSSELPSSLSTPIPTGASTPQYPQPGGGPNPLLVAATTANLPGQSRYPQQEHQHHSSHGQTPMSMKLARMPEYFPEWKDVGFDEAGFLGAQVLAKVLFVVDQGQNMGFMSRVEYNENGPAGIHDI